MRRRPSDHGALRLALISRRELLKSGAVLAGTLPLSALLVERLESNALPDGRVGWPNYILRREVDELFLELTAIGYREHRFLGVRHLEQVRGFEDPCLVFRLPPQHFAETAIGVQRVPATLSEKVLSTISLFPSRPSRLVFRVPHRERLKLNFTELLDWRDFELVLPNLDRVGAPYDLDVQDNDEHPFTRIEMPWGVYLTPMGSYGKATSSKIGLEGNVARSFLWEHSLEPIVSGEWVELWSTVLQNSFREDLPNQFEILGVRGFRRESNTGTASRAGSTVTYSDDPRENLPDWLGCAGNSKGTTPLCNFDRIELATSLSRRFPYTGKPGPPTLNTGLVNYDSRFNPQKVSVNACFAEGRTLAIDQFRLSPRGGSLELDNKWKVFPGCGLKGWKHVASEGLDEEVELVRAGFLFPFGTEAELVTRSEIAFAKDEEGHFIAVVIKQSFLQVPQPNAVDVEHCETLFRSLSITTKRTPPLDLPKSGDPDDYATYDFFLPTVDQRPFEFEHVGIDWAGEPHVSKMPMFFVSNRTLSPNGLIWEVGDEAWTSARSPSAEHGIPADGEGLRVVDRDWNAHPYRFAQYGDSAIAIAKPTANGDTTQRVEWVEWARGSVPKFGSSGVAPRPFQPRVRTMKIRLQGMSQFSGESKFSLATYRDTRFTKYPILDPEPNASPDIYDANLPRDPNDESAAYLFILETRDLLNETGSPSEYDEQMATQRIRAIYYGTSNVASSVAVSLFTSTNNEIQFGLSASSESTGGLSVPDTHVSTLTRRYGPVGDATFNARRWDGYTNRKPRLAAASRLDYAAFRLNYRSKIDVEPFDQSRKQSDVDALQTSAAKLMGFTPAPLAVAAVTMQLAAVSTPSLGSNLNLGDLFGRDAQVLPGLSFADIFKSVAMRDTSTARNSADTATPPTEAADPLQWKFRITGIDWLLQLIGNGPGQLSFKDILSIAATQGQSADTSTPVDFGVEASLQWSNETFNKEKIGPVEFNPIVGKTRVEIDARAKMTLGLGGLPENLSDLKVEPGKAQISARAELKDFSIVVFDAIEIEFGSVVFTLSPDGRKDFTTDIRDVRFKGSLEFINQLSKILKGLGGDSGLDIDISIARVRISETLRFPPKEGDPLFLGPAQVINLVLGFGVMIPLTGRDVLTTSFSLASREKPLTIFVPPWYGGKAHVLLEVTTRGVRLLEVAMEYGALIPIHWGIATGEASLMAGVFYMVEHTPDMKSGRVVFTAFVKATANLDIAGIIHFCGQIFIALSYTVEGNRRLIVGEASVSVSIKIAFVRYSYSFTATHVEEAQGGQEQSAFLVDDMRHGGPSAPGASYITVQGADAPKKYCPRTLPEGRPGDVQLFGTNLSNRRKEAFERIVDGYLM